MPILVGFIGLPIDYALATSKMMVLITASIGLTPYIASNYFRPLTAIPLAFGSFTGATTSAKIILSLSRVKLKTLASTLFYLMSLIVILRLVAWRL